MSLTNLLIAINVVAYVWEVTTGGALRDGRGLLIGERVIVDGEWWRLFTAAFLHGSLPHIGLNMLALYQVGNIVETLYGKVRFALLYALAIVGSGLAVVWFAYDQPTLGASGAIYGLFGALVAVGLRLGARGRSLVGQVIPVIVINLVFTFAVPGISAAAHIGGLITGFLAGLVLFMVPSRQRAYAYSYVQAPQRDDAAPAPQREPETIEQPPE